MQITAKAEYACVAMLELARRQRDGKPIRLAEIVEHHDVPQRFLVQILLQLKAHGLVNTVRGAAGGYLLAKPAEEITLAEILDITDSNDSAKPAAAFAKPVFANLRKVLQRIEKNRKAILKETTLASLAPSNEVLDYMI